MSRNLGSSETPEVERLYRELIEAAPDAVLVIEEGASHFLLVNAAAERLLGYSREELLQMSDVDLLPPDELPRLPEVKRLCDKASCWRGEWRLRRKDGGIVMVEATNTRHEIDGRVLYQGLFRDITERKQAEEGLARREAQLAEAQRLAQVGSWEWNTVTGQAYWSDELYRIFGVEPSGFPTSYTAFLELVHPDDLDRVRTVADAARETGEPFEYEARIIRPDGEVRTIHTRATALGSKSGRPERIIGTVQDVTARRRAVEETERERREKAALLDSTGEGIFGMDLAGRCTFINRAGAALLGYAADEVIGKNMHELVHHSYPDGSPYPVEACPMFRAYASGQTVRLGDDTLWRGDGTAFPVQYSSSPIVEDGRITGAVVTITDITERKRAEQERAEILAREQHRAAQLRALSETVLVFGLEPTFEGLLQAITDRAREIIGAHQAVIGFTTGTNWAQTVSAVSLSEKYAAWRTYEARTTGEGIYRIVCQSNRSMRLTQAELEAHSAWRGFSGEADKHPPLRGWLAAPLVGRDGRNIGLIQVSDRVEGDFTEDDEAILVQLAQIAAAAVEQARLHELAQAEVAERRRAEEVLRESEERFRQFAEHVDQVFWMSDPGKNQMLYVSPATRRIWGNTPESVLADPRSWLNAIHPEDRDRVWEAALTRQVSGDYDETYRIIRPDGTLRWVQDRAFPVRDETGHVYRIVGVATDITREKLAEAAIRESKDQLEEALDALERSQESVVQQERLRALGQMAGGIAHDFNNALGMVIGYAELLLDRPGDIQDPERVREYLGYIHAAGQQAASVVSRLREFYRPREPADAFRPVDLNHLVDEVVALTQPRWRGQALAQGIDISVETSLGAVPPIPADPGELREMLTNLIFNAVDAMPTGGTITIRTAPEGDQVLLVVADTGVGMPAEVRQRCLEPFFTTKGALGTGLGLSMVHGIVRRHEGSIEVSSTSGQGTVFAIRLPGPGIAPQPRLPSRSVRVPNRPLRVLLAEDEPRLRGILARYLTTDGHVVETAADGREALEKFHAGTFDVVVTDRAMPGLGGDQLAVAIRALVDDQPIVMLTGFGDLMNAAGERPAGVDLVLGKPVTLATLRDALARVARS